MCVCVMWFVCVCVESPVLHRTIILPSGFLQLHPDPESACEACSSLGSSGLGQNNSSLRLSQPEKWNSADCLWHLPRTAARFHCTAPCGRVFRLQWRHKCAFPAVNVQLEDRMSRSARMKLCFALKQPKRKAKQPWQPWFFLETNVPRSEAM